MLMLCLGGLFNSANRHKKKRLSAVLLRLQFTAGIHSDGGLFLQLTSVS